MTNLSHNSLSLGQDINPGLSEHKQEYCPLYCYVQWKKMENEMMKRMRRWK
jgi:hypothetical protein